MACRASVSSQGASLVLAHGLSAQQPPQLQPLLTISSAEQKNGPAINQLVFHRAYPHRLFVLLADKVSGGSLAFLSRLCFA